MNYFSYFREIVKVEVEKMSAVGLLPGRPPLDGIAVEPPRDPGHGDIATNAALVLARAAKRKPREIADELAPRLGAHAVVASAEAAGPGFVNLRLKDSFWHARLAEVLEAGAGYGDSELGGGKAVNVEYVSANPTGPLHVGHGRGAVFGDALAALLDKAGFAVTREYYINDAGAQLEALARSVYYRYREALGERPADPPEGFYPGAYLIPVGRRLAERDGAAWTQADAPAWMEACAKFGRDSMMALIRDDLSALGVRQEAEVSERDLHRAGAVEAALAELDAQGLIFTGVLDPPKGKKPDDWEPRPQTLFRATQFGDDSDRPLKKSDGSWTYFASDIAYHRDKFARGFNTMIDVWGADHGGYVKRMKAAVEAVSGGKAALDVKVCQMVNLLQDGAPVKMSKRAGAFVTLREVIDEVGTDVVRFIMLTRRNDAPLDFDFARVTEQSHDNPVFYVQYAHARARSVMRHAAEAFPDADLTPAALAAADLTRLTGAQELALIKAVANWPNLVETAAVAHEPHRVAYYLHDLASAFHALWNQGTGDATLRFIVTGDTALSVARLALVQGLATVIASGLELIGVKPAEELR
jgi:arginyl-tRNA synthetase